MAQGKNWYKEVKKTELTKEQVFQIARWCKESEIEFMASVFDLERLEWLNELKVKKYKVATRMNQNDDFIRLMIRTMKPVLISSNKPLHWSVGNLNVKPLYCIPSYPTQPGEHHFEELTFDSEPNYDDDPLPCFDGFSDHTIGIEASVVAMSRGATIIEKHFCLKRDDSNPDMICSIEPHELKELVGWARVIEQIL